MPPLKCSAYELPCRRGEVFYAARPQGRRPHLRRPSPRSEFDRLGNALQEVGDFPVEALDVDLRLVVDRPRAVEGAVCGEHDDAAVVGVAGRAGADGVKGSSRAVRIMQNEVETYLGPVRGPGGQLCRKADSIACS